jgi:tRNA U38,U39,U40 pseudouridine synthase TruA
MLIKKKIFLPHRKHCGSITKTCVVVYAVLLNQRVKCGTNDLATTIMLMGSTLDVPDSNLGRNINHLKGFHDFSSFHPGKCSESISK